MSILVNYSMSRNLIYTCVFSNENYVKLTIELIKSFLKSNPEENGCDFLVYTNQSYRDLILAEITDTRIKFHINNYYNTMNQSRISKIDIFDYKELHNYEKILYLDTDSLITGDVNQMFSEFQNEKTETMFVLKEGNVLAENELWGRTLFMKNAKTEDRPGIQACVFGFINRDSGNIKKMFLKIKQQFFLDMYQGKLLFYDQPYLNYNFYESGLCKLDTETLAKYCNGGARTYNSQYIIHHFSGCPGNYSIKSELVNDFKNTMPTNQCLPSVKSKAIVALRKEYEVKQQESECDYICFMENEPEVKMEPWRYEKLSDFFGIVDNYSCVTIRKNSA